MSVSTRRRGHEPASHSFGKEVQAFFMSCPLWLLYSAHADATAHSLLCLMLTFLRFRSSYTREGLAPHIALEEWAKHFLHIPLTFGASFRKGEGRAVGGWLHGNEGKILFPSTLLFRFSVRWVFESWKISYFSLRLGFSTGFSVIFGAFSVFSCLVFIGYFCGGFFYNCFL